MREFHRLPAEKRLVSAIVSPEDTAAAQAMMETALLCGEELKRINS